MNDNILYHARLALRSPRPDPPFRRYNAKAPEKGGAKKSRTMMSREWVKDTREAWAWAGDLEQAAELSRKPNVHLGPQAYRAGDLEREGRG